MREKLIVARKRKRYTQEKVAELTKMKREKYAKIELGLIEKVSFVDAYNISKVLEVNAEDIFLPFDVL